ncbi:ABC transporter substrate-binding protein [Devosia sp. XGJD_8]|uniref:ABC transporter substrate-binding protein n=1 Tax=Devosia sp. XGJD_8 TaxID=3391187 RepID=UPI003985265B
MQSSAVLAAILAAGLALATPAMARDVTHAMGVTDVPDAPLRIVALTNEAAEDLVALGIIPVGAARSANSDPWYDYLGAQLADTMVTGEELAPDLEAIAVLQPDLILGNKRRHEKIYDQLSAIAPTVFAASIQGTWKDNLSLYAEAVGKPEQGAALLADYRRRLDAIRAGLGERIKEDVSVVRFLAGQSYAYFPASFSGSVLADIGFARPAAQNGEGLAELITKERIGELAADRILHFTYETGDGLAISEGESWMAEPLWQNLEAAKTGQVYGVSDAVWATAGGFMAAQLALDDIETIYGLPTTR